MNIRKNRFYDILPYDYNRVKLNHSKLEKTDYINATYVKNDLGQITHIAAQGPIGELETLGGRRDTTIRDFWHMIWQENVECIVMLTLCVEGLRHKCAIYWPENAEEPIKIDDTLQMTMTCITEDEICFQREIKLEKAGQKPRMIMQWHYKDWLDCTAPENSELLLSFMQKIRKENYNRPKLVHCSAGVGRTGVYICLDLLLDALDKSKHINVFEMVKMLRETRVNMVQTPEQYATIYETIAMAIRQRQNSSVANE
uniref:Uncharacterized protein n=1 Tax=Acrobeloides nanus TaxID=290746 RepID=A0A914EMS6_9BILA